MKTEIVIVVVVAAAAALYLVTRKAAPQVSAPGSVGAYGVQTHIPVSSAGVALGGLLGSSLSSWFGGGTSSPGGIAPDRNTPSLGSIQLTNPVYPLPSVLPYSYKQQVIDTPALLNTDSVFTPPSDLYSNIGGDPTQAIGGGYADQGTSSDTTLSGTSTFYG